MGSDMIEILTKIRESLVKIQDICQGMIGTYNKLSPFYDGLSRLVFWGNIQKANVLFINDLPANSKVLIMGGGTGKLLEVLPEQIEVDYVDFSSQMILRAKRRKCKAKIHFHTIDFLQFEEDKNYDAILCPFFLDQFNKAEMGAVLTKIVSTLKDRGTLLVSDFYPAEVQPGSLQKIVLWFTLQFFKRFNKLTISKLENIHNHLLSAGFSLEKEQKFYFGMIFSTKWINGKH